MESKKLEKPRENGTFSTVQGVMKPDEEGRRRWASEFSNLLPFCGKRFVANKAKLNKL